MYTTTLAYFNIHKERVLLTGHKGFIGSKLKQRLEHLQFQVIGIDKQDGNDLLDCELPQ